MEHPVSESLFGLLVDETDALGEVDDEDDADDMITLPAVICPGPTPTPLITTKPGSVLV